MIVRILGDSHRNFDGQFVAQFINNNEIQHELKFDLNNWESIGATGIVGGHFIRIVSPVKVIMNFDQEYEVTEQQATTLYNNLKEIGWK